MTAARMAPMLVAAISLPALPKPRFDTFPRHDELTRLLSAYAEAAPALVSVASIGKSHEGRDIWVVTLTNRATGPAGRNSP